MSAPALPVTPAVETRALRRTFKASRGGAEVQALSGVDLRIERGEVFGLLGPNGAGKTTFIKILTTLLYPDSGEARVAGFDVVREDGEVRRRIDRLDGTLHTYVTVAAERALDDARRAEREIAGGGYRGALHGVPIGLKDIVDAAGIRTTAGSLALREHVPASDATVVSKLRDAGAVVIGKLGTWEFAIGEPSLGDPIPPPRNSHRGRGSRARSAPSSPAAAVRT